MDDTWLWAFGASWTGIAFSIVVWFVSFVRNDTEARKKHASALTACLVLSGVLVVLMALFGPTDERQDTAAFTGIIVGAVSGVFTGFGITGGKPPTGPPG